MPRENDMRTASIPSPTSSELRRALRTRRREFEISNERDRGSTARRGEDTRSGRNALLPATGGRADTLSLAYVDIIACQFRVTLLIA